MYDSHGYKGTWYYILNASMVSFAATTSFWIDLVFGISAVLVPSTFFASTVVPIYLVIIIDLVIGVAIMISLTTISIVMTPPVGIERILEHLRIHVSENVC